MSNNIYWQVIGRTKSVVLIKQIETDLVFAWTRQTGWHRPTKSDYDNWYNEIIQHN